MKKLEINLDLPPAERWLVLEPYKAAINELIGYYLEDLGDVSFFAEAIEFYKAQYVSPTFLEEIRTVASFSRFTENQILITNLYYDALKFVFGCTAFCHQGSLMRIHARNLDWWTENDALSRLSMLFQFTKGGKVLYSAVSWPGFVGILSGMRHDAYSITLNAVSSEEAPNMALPITFLIREVLEQENQFEAAVQRLSKTSIASDCLLMIVGKEPQQACVIERTPTTFAERLPKNECLVVTNDYKKLVNHEIAEDVLQSTSCGRYDGALRLMEAQIPQSNEDYLRILKHPDVKMNITVQQMVFNLSTNEIILE